MLGSDLPVSPLDVDRLSRRERREYYITPRPAELRGQEAWAGLQSVVQVITTIKYQGRETNEVRYYLSSLPPVRGARIAKCVRQHWGIENGLRGLRKSAGWDDQLLASLLLGTTRCAPALGRLYPVLQPVKNNVADR